MKTKAQIAGDVFEIMKKRASEEGKQITVERWESTRRRRSNIKLHHKDSKFESWQEAYIGKLSDIIWEDVGRGQEIFSYIKDKLMINTPPK